MDIERNNNRTEVIVDEGINTVSYALDEQLIEALTLIQVSLRLRAFEQTDMATTMAAEQEEERQQQ